MQLYYGYALHSGFSFMLAEYAYIYLKKCWLVLQDTSVLT